MNPQLRAYLRMAAPNMPPEMSWPLVEKCMTIEDMKDVPPDMVAQIERYLPKGMTVQTYAQKAESGWDEAAHPRGKTTDVTNTGSFAPSKGAGSSGEPEGTQGPIGPSTIGDLTKLSMGDRRTAFAAMTREHQDAIADPRNSVPKRMDELLGPDVPFKSVEDYVSQYAHILPPDNQAVIIDFMTQTKGDALAVGLSEEQATQLQHALTRSLIAQDFEAAGRTLGDHGSYHLRGDAMMAKEALAALPTNANTPENRLLMDIVAVAHDMGYLTPPAREFLDEQHPRWSQQYFDEHMRPTLEGMLGKDMAAQASTMVANHDAAILDWETKPEQSAMSMADNLALFHKEKMPPMLRHVPGNIDALVRLGEGKLSVEDAQSVMRANIANSNLSPELKAAYSHAVKEVSGVLPKYTLGMVGTSYKGMAWNKEAGAMEVHMQRSAANEGLAKVVDFGYKQFKKFAETYGGNADDLIKKGKATFTDANGVRVRLIATLITRKGEVDLGTILRRNWFFSLFTGK